MSGASVAQLLGQTVLTGGPVLLAVAGGAPQQITALFAGLALFRAPYTLALGVVTQLTERLTLLVVQDRRDALRRFRGWVVGVTLGGAVLAAVFGAVAGPPLMALIFGAGVELDSELTLLLAVGNTFALANLVFTITMLARGRPVVLVRGWLIGALPGALLFLPIGGSGARAHLLDLRGGRGGRVLLAAPGGRPERLSRAGAQPGRPMTRTAGRGGVAPGAPRGTDP